MRPFFEQYHYENRPIKKVGAGYIPEYRTDFVRWHNECRETTPNVRDRKDNMTAVSELSKKQFHQTSRRGIGSYAKRIEEWPNFYKSTSFMAMTVLHALTMPMPRHQPADKLNVGD